MMGLDHIGTVFSGKKLKSRSALMPYYTLGYPTLETSLKVIESIAASGADLIELGIPFSDPLADGPTIQHSTQVALENGINVKGCLQMVRTLRLRGVSQPLMLMGYYNPILAYGPEKFAEDACEAGADGLIVPDLPLEESVVLESACQAMGLALVYLIAPTTPEDRLLEICQHSSGFVYIVSLIGVTGARSQIERTLPEFITYVRQITRQSISVGFGISTPAQAAEVGKLADGVIIGSALIDKVREADDPSKAAGEFIAAIRKALME
jgi:tryptophan synthase alpha chain